MKKTAMLILLLYVCSISGFAQSLSFIGNKTESDTITNSLREAAKNVTSLKGVDKNNTIAVLIVEDSGKETMGFGGGSGSTLKKLLVNVPVIGWFTSINSTVWSASRLAQPTDSGKFGNMYSRSSIAEAFIISELIDKGYTVVEASTPFYGDVNSILTNEQEIRNYGRQLGADTVVIGSVGGSIYKVIEDENYFTLNRYFVSDLKMNIRSVSTQSNQILDSDTFSGVDSVNTLKNIKWGNIIVTVLLAGVAIAGISGAFDSDDDDDDDDDYYNNYNDQYN